MNLNKDYDDDAAANRPCVFWCFGENVDEVSFRGKCSAVGNTVWKSF